MKAQDPCHPDLALAEAAAQWIVRLSADDPGEQAQARRGFEDWKRADPRRAAVAARMEGFLAASCVLGDSTGPAAKAARATLGTLVEPPARRVPRPRSGQGRKGLPAMLVLVLALVLPALVAWNGCAPGMLLADMHTGTGEQRRELLADGTQLTLSSGTALNQQLGLDLRRIELLRGAVLVDVAKDARRPFVVDTPHGRIQALGTRFIVRLENGATRLTMIESRTSVRAGEAGAATQTLEAGQQARLTPGGLEWLEPVSPGVVEDAFRLRRLVVRDMPMAEVLDELARHRDGLLRYDRQALEGLRVSAVLPLDDTGRALQLLVDSFPQLRVRMLTRWAVWVDASR